MGAPRAWKQKGRKPTWRETMDACYTGAGQGLTRTGREHNLESSKLSKEPTTGNSNLEGPGKATTVPLTSYFRQGIQANPDRR